MTSAIKTCTLLPAQGVELVTMISGLGTEMQLYLAVSDSANRQANIDAGLTQLDANDAAIQAYSEAHNVSIAGQPS